MLLWTYILATYVVTINMSIIDVHAGNAGIGISYITAMALLFTGRYFSSFTKKVALRENIIMNSYVNVALLQCYISAS